MTKFNMFLFVTDVAISTLSFCLAFSVWKESAKRHDLELGQKVLGWAGSLAALYVAIALIRPFVQWFLTAPNKFAGLKLAVEATIFVDSTIWALRMLTRDKDKNHWKIKIALCIALIAGIPFFWWLLTGNMLL